MGNEAWLILLARGHKQSVGNQRRGKHNPCGPTSCCMSWSSFPMTRPNVKFLHIGSANTQTSLCFEVMLWYLPSITLLSLPQSFFFFHSFYLSGFLSFILSSFLSFSLLFRLCCASVYGERPGTKLSRWGTLMGQSWLSGLSAYMHAMQTMRPLLEWPASPSRSGRDEGWSPGRLWLTLNASVRACVCVCVCVCVCSCLCACASHLMLVHACVPQRCEVDALTLTPSVN